MAIFYKVAAGQNAFTVATRVDGPVPEYPFNDDLTAIVWRETWWQLADNYVELPRNTVHSTLPGAYLVGESGHTRKDGGILVWQRTYATIPATRYDYESYAATFPGIAYATFSERRLPVTRGVTSQLTLDYFLVGTGGAYTAAGDIPAIAPTSFRYPTDTIDRGPGDIYLGPATTPTLAVWSAAVTAALYTYTPEPSTLQRYLGNIWCRITRNVRPL